MTLYDSTATQTIPLEIRSGAKIFQVQHLLAPLTDKDFLELAAATRRAEGKRDEIDLLVKSRSELWEKLAQGVKGYRPAEDWKRGIKADDRVAATKALDSAQIALPDEADEDELAGFDTDLTHTLEVLFSGVRLKTTHTLREPSAEDRRSVIQALRRARTVVKNENHRTLESYLADFYDKLVLDQTGYAEGSAVPIWHKTTVALEHLKLTGEAVEKNF